MEAYCVSKRPPRALYLGLAIVLGMVAVSTVVLTQMGGGLLRDGTYPPLGLHAIESRRRPDRAERPGRDRLARRPVRVGRPGPDPGAAPGGRRTESLGRPGEFDRGPGAFFGPKPGPGPGGCPRAQGTQWDPR